jgi:hypothetical protein
MTLGSTRIACVLVVAACSGSSSPNSSVAGQAVYRDAATDHQGAAQQPAAPPAQHVAVSVTIEGTGQIPHIDPKCAVDPAGSFEAHYAGTANLASDRAYLASFGDAAQSIVTPSGCAISDFTVGVVTDVVIRGELVVTTQNCNTYCAASARAAAEAQCGATASAAQCRSSAETTAQASCTTTCTSQAHAITAELALGAGALTHADADLLRAAAFGDLQANLRFDHMTDANGHVLDP